MKKIICSLVIIFCSGVMKLSFAQTVYESYWDGQLYLKLKNEVTVTLPDYDSNHPSSYKKEFSSFINRYGIYSIRKAFPLLKTIELQHTYKILFHRADQADQLIKALQELVMVDYAEKVPLRQIVLTPNDPLFNNQYALTNIDAASAWSLSTGSHSVTVAIVDDEVRLDHQDLTANRWVNPGEIPGNGLDDEGDGYIDDVNGFDVADYDPDPGPPPTVTNNFQTHGTHCSGIADAVGNNNTGIASIGFGLSLMAVKCNPDTITSSTFIYYAMEGVEYAIAAGADVISMSWGGDGFSFTEQNVFDNGWAQGIIFVAAAGNNSSSLIYYPAGYNHIVSVGSTDATDAISGFSNFGTWVSVMAPGSSIYSTKAGSNSSYGNLSGTSMSAPLVAGLCGLIKSYDSLLTNAQIVSCLQSSCDNIDAQNPGFLGQLGAGRINALGALQCANPDALPVAAFSALNPNSCNGTVSFTDRSVFNPSQWLWDFGDGDTSTQQNPTHLYLASNSYTVTLTVTNTNGTDVEVQTNYVTINLPASPVTSPAAVCSGTSATLTATGTDSLYWFTSPAGGTPVATGSTYPTPVLNSNTVYYVESDVYPLSQSAGPADNTFGGGSYFTGSNYHDIIFDCYFPARLLYVKVYAQTAGFRTITLFQNGLMIQSASVNIPVGTSIVPLNFNLPAAINLELGIQGNVDLYRNNSGALFPYTVAGLISIKGTNAGDQSYYYYFYDWQLQASPCISPRVPVVATVIPSAIAAFSSGIAVDTVNFIDQSTNSTGWLWNFGDTLSGLNNTSTLQSPSHRFTSDGTYNVCLMVNGSSGCNDTICQAILFTSVGTAGNVENSTISLFPNPATNSVTISLNLAKPEHVKFELVNALGQQVYSSVNYHLQAGKSQVQIATDKFPEGVYELFVRTDESLNVKKLAITR